MEKKIDGESCSKVIEVHRERKSKTEHPDTENPYSVLSTVLQVR